MPAGRTGSERAQGSKKRPSLPASGSALTSFYDIADQTAFLVNEEVVVAELHPMRARRRPHQIKARPIHHLVESAVTARDVLALFVNVRRRIVGVAAARLIAVRSSEIASRIRLDGRRSPGLRLRLRLRHCR